MVPSLVTALFTSISYHVFRATAPIDPMTVDAYDGLFHHLMPVSVQLVDVTRCSRPPASDGSTA